MSDLERAAYAFEVSPTELQEFAVEDPFNDGNWLTGFVCRRGDRRYGSLYISTVNGAVRPQTVYATPKFPYPFDRNGVFRFPPAQRVEAYEKLDGTNVFAYSYRGWNGRRYVTYKTRLLPVLGESRFGPFLTYWREILQRYPGIPAAVLEYDGFGLSFELYGARNRHLVIYDVPLDARLLFGVNRYGRLEPPTAVASECPCPAPAYRAVRTGHALVNLYKEVQAELEAGLEADEVLGGYRGVEGRMWYLLTDDGWQAFKCKPETIEAIHWAAGGIGKQTVVATAWNVLEDHERCTPELVRELLLEEFNPAEIDRAWPLVLRASQAVNEEAELRATLFERYERWGLDIRTNKATALRALAEFYPKARMRYVYAVLEQRYAGTTDRKEEEACSI